MVVHRWQVLAKNKKYTWLIIGKFYLLKVNVFFIWSQNKLFLNLSCRFDSQTWEDKEEDAQTWPYGEGWQNRAKKGSSKHLVRPTQPGLGSSCWILCMGVGWCSSYLCVKLMLLHVGSSGKTPQNLFSTLSLFNKNIKSKWASTGVKYRWAKSYSNNSRHMKCLNLFYFILFLSN